MEVIPSSHFPSTLAEISSRKPSSAVDIDGLALYGGAGRSTLLESTLGIVRPVRDLDLIAIGRKATNRQFVDTHHALNPKDRHRASTKVVRFKTTHDAIDSVDLTIHQTVLPLTTPFDLIASPQAIEDATAKIIAPSDKRIEETKQLATGGEATHRQYLRNRTSVLARAAYLAAVLRADGHDFTIELRDHPRPNDPSETHRFFLGTMVKRALMMDELERGPEDITATTHLFDIYRELDISNLDSPVSPEEVIAFCEDVNDQYPQLRFTGSKISSRVTHTKKLPPPKRP